MELQSGTAEWIIAGQSQTGSSIVKAGAGLVVCSVKLFVAGVVSLHCPQPPGTSMVVFRAALTGRFRFYSLRLCTPLELPPLQVVVLPNIRQEWEGFDGSLLPFNIQTNPTYSFLSFMQTASYKM
jgi:hypothetical protein